MQYYKKNGSLLLSDAISIPTLSFVFYLLLAFGLTTSPAIISISIGLLFLTGIIHAFKNKLRMIPKMIPIFFMLPILIFLVNCLYYFCSDAPKEMANELRIKLPMLLLPLSAWMLPPLNPQQIRRVLKMFIFVVFGVTTASMINYFIHYEELNKLMFHSKAIPIVTLTKNYSHIYFGVMAAFSVMAGWYLFLQTGKPERWIWLAVATGILIELHVIASRTGLVTVYAGIILEIGRMVWVHKKWFLGLGLVCGLMVSVYIAFMTIPSLQLKLENTRRDIQYLQGNHNFGDWSLTRRILVWKMSIDMIHNHPFVGLGPVGSKEYLTHAYDHYGYDVPAEDRITDPHNQYLQMGIDFGLGGISLLLGMLWSPFYLFGRKLSIIFVSFCFITAIGMLFESLLERQYGISFFMCFWGLFLKTWEEEK